MSTSNFYNKNASKVFAVFMEDEIDSDFYEDEIDYFRERLASLPFNFTSQNYWEQNGLRSYEAKIIASLESSKSFGDIEITVLFNILLRNGYYQGANLDWEVLYNREDLTEIDFSYEFESSYLNAGLKKILQRKAENWANQITEVMQHQIEAILTEISTPLIVSAHFSNGETWYKKAN